MSRVEVHIGSLELQGVPTSHGPIVAAAVERELARLLGERGFQPGPAIDVPAAPGSPHALGIAIARAVHARLPRPEAP